MEVLKETRINSLTLIAKAKGEAHSSNEDSSFSVYQKYYTIRRQLLEEARQDGNVCFYFVFFHWCNDFTTVYNVKL